MTTNNNEEVDVYDVLLEKLGKKVNTAEAVYTLCYEDLLAVIAEVYGEESLDWDEDKLLSVVADAKGWLEDSVDWFQPTCEAIEGQLEEEEEE